MAAAGLSFLHVILFKNVPRLDDSLLELLGRRLNKRFVTARGGIF